MAAIDPMHQFLIHKVVDIPAIATPWGPLDMSITNSIATLLVGAVLICLWFLVTARGQLVPGRAQALGEGLYNIIDRALVEPIIGHKGRPYIPFLMTIFMLVLFLNLMGLLFNLANLGGAFVAFTVTSQLAITGALALITFITVLITGLVINGPRFFKLFVPSGVPWAMLPMLVIIELVSFFVRPLTLAMRLFGNMVGGHVVLNIFASFVVGLGLFAITTGGLAYLGLLGSGLAFLMIVAIIALEFVVAFLQAFVFAALAAVYLNEVVNLGHGH